MPGQDSITREGKVLTYIGIYNSKKGKKIHNYITDKTQ